LAVVRQISADAYISAYLPVLGYIPKLAEDYGPRIARKEVWLLERSGRAVGCRSSPKTLYASPISSARDQTLPGMRLLAAFFAED
jgi:hypothetical protein